MRCAVRDGVTAQYARIEEADAVFVGSPIYFGTVSAATKIFDLPPKNGTSLSVRLET